MHHPHGLAAGLLAGLLLGAPLAHAQLPPGDGPVTLTGTLTDPTPLPFDESRLASLKLPPGFKISVFAQNLQNVRWLQVAPNGDVYASRRQQGDVLLLRDTNRDGVADERKTVAQNIKWLNGLALHGKRLYMVSDRKVLLADVQPDGSLGLPRVIIDDLPDAGQHPNRTLAIGPDGQLYITVGSTCNSCRETNGESATLLVARPDGSGRSVYARGLRNTLGFGWHPGSGALYGFDHGSDWRGDDQPPEELNRIEKNKDYGWPWCYGERQVDRLQANEPPHTTKADFCPTTEAPALTYTAHAAPIGMVFYTGSQFPADYRHSAFVAMRGSWNRAVPSGYKVVRVRFDAAGKPLAIEDFATGWLVAAPPNAQDPGHSHSVAVHQKVQRPARFGRLAGLAQAPDGSLLVAEDENGVIYRISYEGR
ncbi:PQQ-dependent sugar dehydrogenase [Aquabacterium sp. A7-Y]|uniref:PQQ-dependent sugar dehydrogenase n=1 Tax=Aquabacterium sp. A7-Y TaxID=1349605 RepID=UPI00223D23CC|nr:PQQ-dependent sugar dehydrogenase [Aquabacterium sp. A7-Y]MCW7538359.1 PQQ-dependent sugar dehydrogenase [Aquabacterium sp. A7-Y]